MLGLGVLGLLILWPGLSLGWLGVVLDVLLDVLLGLGLKNRAVVVGAEQPEGFEVGVVVDVSAVYAVELVELVVSVVLEVEVLVLGSTVDVIVVVTNTVVCGVSKPEVARVVVATVVSKVVTAISMAVAVTMAVTVAGVFESESESESESGVEVGVDVSDSDRVETDTNPGQVTVSALVASPTRMVNANVCVGTVIVVTSRWAMFLFFSIPAASISSVSGSGRVGSRESREPGRFHTSGRHDPGTHPTPVGRLEYGAVVRVWVWWPKMGGVQVWV